MFANKDKIKKAQELIYVTCAVLFILVILRGFYIAGKQTILTRKDDYNNKVSSPLMPLNDDWLLHHEDGSVEKISLPYQVTSKETEVTITKDITGLLSENDIIKFDNNRQGIEVSVDDKVIYQVNTTSLTKQLAFTDYQIVHLPDQNPMSQLSLRFIYKMGEYYSLPEISYGSYDTASSEIIRNDIITLVILVVLSMVLLAGFLVYIYCRFHHMTYGRIRDLLIFVLTAILWGYTDSYLPTLWHIPQEVLGLVCYLSIMALPIPMCEFVGKCCKERYSIFRTISMMGALNMIVQIVLSAFGIIQLQYTFYSAHIFIVAVIFVSLICGYQTRKEDQTKKMDILYLGIVILAMVALLSLFQYWQKGVTYYRVCMLAGILFFSIILFCYVIFHYLGMAQREQLRISEIKIHERLSLLDSLTGLPNRRAFESKMNEIEENMYKIKDAVFIMLDVNGLKMVNDKYGHAAGDDLIVAAARVIQTAYGQIGNCYRIGGDEFAVIIEDLTPSMSIFDTTFEKMIEKTNDDSSLWKLSIAKGLSHLRRANGKLLTISDWKQEADVSMYRNKVSMTGGQTRDRAKDLKDIINCIIGTVEAKDVYTAAHSERVRELSYSIAKNLGVSPFTLQIIESAANLHDIGKIGIPDYVLLKPGQLTDEEYEIMKRHTTIGAGIIRQAKGMQEIANIVLHHHERWDGKGYPDGLANEEIPFESRVIAVADSIDAMTSRRVYHECMTLDECRKELEKNAGIMYDPAITQIVLQNWQEIVDIVLLHPKRLINGNTL